MDKEDKELAAISGEFHPLVLGGETVKLRYPMRAWKKIKLEYGGFSGIQKLLAEDPMDFITDRLPGLIVIGDTEGKYTAEAIADLLDEYTLTGIKNEVLTIVMEAMTDTLPEPKAVKGKN